MVTVGQELTFTITIQNQGDSRIDVIPVEDLYEPQVLEFLRSNIRLPQVSASEDHGRLFWNDITLALGDLEPGSAIAFVVTFRLREAVHTVNLVRLVPDVLDEHGNPVNPAQGESSVDIVPTAIELLSFSATAARDSVEVHWTTGREVGTWGFHLWRGASPDRARAVRITPSLILAKGRYDAGASYRYLDSTPRDGAVFYWLQEIELDGAINEYGPVSLGSEGQPMDHAFRVFLPAVQR